MTLNGNVEVTFRTAAGTAASGTLTLSNTISRGTPGSSLTKEDTNTLTVAGTDSYSGGTTVNDGTFILNGINSNTANTLTVNAQHAGSAHHLGRQRDQRRAGDVQRRPSGRAWAARPARLVRGTSRSSGTRRSIFSLGSATTAGGGVNDLLNVNGDFDADYSSVLHQPGGRR